MRTDLRLAWLLVRGSDRQEWWRIGLTAVGALCATGLALAAVALAALRGGQYGVPLAHGLLDQPGERRGVVFTLLLLEVPVLGFLGQCARIGAVHRDRRLASLRLAGAEASRVRRIAALETGPACLLGSVLAVAVAVPVLLSLWHRPTPFAWAGVVVVAAGVPVLGTAAGVPALRRVVTTPLGRVRRIGPRRSGCGPGLWFLAGMALAVAAATVSISTSVTVARTWRGSGTLGTLSMLGAVVAVGAGSVWLAGALSGLTGRSLAGRTGSPAVLIAAERLRADPWATARTHAALMLVTVVGTGYTGVRHVLLADLYEMRRRHELGTDLSFYTSGLDLTAAAIVLALVITAAALATGTAESLATRRRGLAAQVAAGVPRAVLARALLLETALPLAPALLVAGAGGLAIGLGYAHVAVHYGRPAFPYWSLLVPVAVHAACLLAAAASLPLLRRSVRPGELRYA
ncbi:ABC transporter permease [Streptomyces sp. NPDC018610]|uniref:ABC transporter permease n=1 Tax=Streptomyces sp. NPDC018610 TaxID=3365049 RepID=UPI0037B12BCB